MSDTRGAENVTTSVIVCSRRRPRLLAETVASILRGEQVPDELVIIDQSPTPHPTLSTLTTSRPCAIRYHRTDAVGVSNARNAGIAAARGMLLVFTDDDVLVTPTWFGAITQALRERGPAYVVTGRVLEAAEEGGSGFAPSTISDDQPAVYAGRVERDVLFTGNMALFRSTLDQVGLFDPRLGAGTRFSNAEDNDFGFRLLEAGFRIAYTPDAMLYHRAWRGSADYLALRWSYGRGQGGFLAKHFNGRDRYTLRRLARIAAERSLAAPGLLRRDPRRAVGNLVYVLGLLSGAGLWLLTQPQTP